MAFLEPLNLEKIFINYVAGSMEIFLFLTAKFRMPNSIFLLLIGVFTIFLATQGYTLLYGLTILFAGIFAFISLSNYFKK